MKKTLLLLFVLFTLTTKAQVNENYTQVYDYVYRMAQKGIIEIQDYILPLDRLQLSKALRQVATSNALSTTERKEVNFYLQEFAYDTEDAAYTKDSFSILRKDKAARFRLFHTTTSKATLFIDPVFGATYSSFNKGIGNNRSYFGGARIWGNIGKHIGYNLFFRDVTEKGDTIDFAKSFTPVTGIVNSSNTPGVLNYSNINCNLTYRWSNGALSIGKDQLTWGYGLSGKVVLSSKAPSFPYVRLDYKPFKWLYFNYFHAWLNSNVLDSNRTYNTGTGVLGGIREVYHPKYMVSHSINITPVKGLDVSIGETMIYSDKLDVGYFIPINFFKAYDQYSSSFRFNGGGNSQFYGQISSRNHIKNTHAYIALFVDEISISGFWDKAKRRNQSGFTIGLNKTDILLPYLTLGAEYTRINPFTYRNITPAQNYTNESYSLGDWMGNNADRLYVFTRYTPLPRVRLQAYYQKVRKGSAGTLDQQYLQPQPDFLFDKIFDASTIGFTAQYELYNRLNFSLAIAHQKMNYFTPAGINSSITQASFGFSYGL